MKITERFKRLTLWNKIAVIGSFASILGIALFFMPFEKDNKAISHNQKGGITAGNIESINITNISPENSATLTAQQEKDIQLALIYKFELYNLFHLFKTCLHWTLPLGEQVDIEVERVFNYGAFTKTTNFENINHQTIIKIFTQYDFTKPMPNFSYETGNKPTGFNNILGILEYFNDQLNKHLDKYGGAASVQLTTQMEYTQRMTESTVNNIRLQLHTYKAVNEHEIENIADYFIRVRDDLLTMQENTKGISGGYPITAGMVTKSDDKDGEIIVQSHFSFY